MGSQILHERRLHNKDLVTSIVPMNRSAFSPQLGKGFLFWSWSRSGGLVLIPDCSTSRSCLYLLQICSKCSKSRCMISCQWQTSFHKPIQPLLDPQHHSYLQPTICFSWSADALGWFLNSGVLLSTNPISLDFTFIYIRALTLTIYLGNNGNLFIPRFVLDVWGQLSQQNLYMCSL